MSRRARYICFEGVEGCGKSTHCTMLSRYLTAKNKKLLLTKEPGTDNIPLTMEMRRLILDAANDPTLTTTARELITQAIRSVHIEKLIMPALLQNDYIIQDRGLLSGMAYGHASGNSHWFLTQLTNQVLEPMHLQSPYDIYDCVVYLRGNPAQGLKRAQKAKQEFAAGDVMEKRGEAFLQRVSDNMDEMVEAFPRCIINIEGRSREENFEQILRELTNRGLI